MQLASILRPTAAGIGASQGALFAVLRGIGVIRVGVHQNLPLCVHNGPCSLLAYCSSTLTLGGSAKRSTTSAHTIRWTAPVVIPPRGLRPPSSTSTWLNVARDMSRGGAASSSSAESKELKTAEDVLSFWFGDEQRLETDPEYLMERNQNWWGLGPVDQDFVDVQVASKDLIAKAAKGELKGGDWDGPRGALAKLLLLDQFPRTVSRGTAKAFEHDEEAATLAMEIVSNNWDLSEDGFGNCHKIFMYVPLMHSERLEAQNLGVAKSQVMYDQDLAAGKKPNPLHLEMAKEHRDVIAKFGRFPHRNAVLGRESTSGEEEWLKSDSIPLWATSQSAPKSDDPA